MKSIVICGSLRFATEIFELAQRLEKVGAKVYTPENLRDSKDWKKVSKEFVFNAAAGLTYLHFEKIKKADIVFIYNKNQYIGVSTTMEMGYAGAFAKPIYLLEEDTEIARSTLTEGVLSEESLVQLLNS